MSQISSYNLGNGNDTLYFTSQASGTSIIGGAGNDFVNFASSEQASGASVGASFANTFYFGTNGGSDTIAFNLASTISAHASKNALTVAFSDSIGSTAAASLGYNTSTSTSTITFGTNNAGAIYITGVSAGAVVLGSSASAGVNIVSVSNASITAFG
jgi:hypothetical protein